jgi:acyl dehydratase
MSASVLTFEDFQPAQTYDCGEHLLDENEIIAFASEFDPQPQHTDPAAAESGMLGGLIASGWHLCAISIRLIVDHLFNRSTSLGSPGVDEIQWRRPARPGDRLHIVVTVLETRPSASRSDRGLVRIRVDMTRDEQRVMFWTSTIMFGRKDARDVA